MQFSLFLGLSNLELLQDEPTLSPRSRGLKARGSDKVSETPERRSSINKEILEPPKLKVSAPRHICSLFQDVSELFEKILEPYPKVTSSMAGGAQNHISILGNIS